MTDDNNAKNKINISDEQLDEWLANVSLPNSLHDDLLRIPEDHSDQVTLSSIEQGNKATESGVEYRSNTKLWTAMVVAACYLILAGSVWIFWPHDPEVNQAENGPSQNDDIAGSRDTDKAKQKSKNVKPNSVDLVQNISERNQTLDSIEEKLNDIKIRELEKRLAKAESESQFLETRETASIVLAIADQTPVNFGASKESISGDMTKVIAEYPDSRGAAIASQFIHPPNW